MRNENIGGTDAPVIVGASPWMNKLELWQIKTGRRAKPEPTKEERERMNWGLLLEALIIQELLKERNEEYNEYKHNVFFSNDFRVGYLDYIYSPDEFFEIKTASSYKDKDWALGVPEYYLWQVVHYFSITKAKKATVACLIGGQHLITQTVHRDEALIKALLEAEQDFHNCVINDIEPEIEAVPEPVVQTTMDEQVANLVEKYFETNNQLKEFEAELYQIKKAIQVLVGKDREQVGEQYKVSYKYVAQYKYNMELLFKENDIDPEKYKINSGFYRLDIRNLKGE